MSHPVSNHHTVILTERGPTIAGSRITIYDVMDYVTAGWPPQLIRDRLQLTDAQVADALSYIDANRAEVEREYQAVLRTAAENRRYWEERNRDRFCRPGEASPRTAMQENSELRAKLREWKAKRGASTP
jgi:uncharacterized protein (DUF433 family)